MNEFEIEWWQRVREDSINAIQSPEIESDQVEEISDDDGSNDQNDELEQESIGLKEIITMLDKIKPYPAFDDDSQYILPSISKWMDLQLKCRKQSSLNPFMTEAVII